MPDAIVKQISYLIFSEVLTAHSSTTFYSPPPCCYLTPTELSGLIIRDVHKATVFSQGFNSYTHVVFPLISRLKRHYRATGKAPLSLSLHSSILVGSLFFLQSALHSLFFQTCIFLNTLDILKTKGKKLRCNPSFLTCNQSVNTHSAIETRASRVGGTRLMNSVPS